MDQVPQSSNVFTESAVTLSIPNEATPLINDSKFIESDLESEPTLQDAWEEIKVLFFNSAPNIVAFFMQAAMPLASVFSLGHLGPKPLGAAALSNMFAAITGWSLSIGMSSCLDTLCSSSFTGSKDLHVVGLHTQRGILVSLTMFLPISVVWWNSESLMLLLGQDEELSKLCGTYLRVFLLAAPPMMTFECLKKFLQAQRIMKAQTYILASVIPVYLVLNYLFILNPSTSFGFLGAPLASVITYWLMLILGVLYIAFIDGKKCWGGWSRQALFGWGVYLRLGIPGIFQVCSEWWAFEIMALSCSYMGTNQLAAHSIATSITNACFSIAIGQGIAVSNRIGNLLGAGLPNRAKLTSRCAILLAIILPNVSVFTILIFRHQLVSLFTSEQGVIDILLQILPMVALYNIVDSAGAVCGGIMRGQGRQKIGAVANFVAFYILAIPLGLYAAFQLNYGVLGLWIGNSFALTLTSSTLALFIINTNWSEQVEICRHRLNQSNTPHQE